MQREKTPKSKVFGLFGLEKRVLRAIVWELVGFFGEKPIIVPQTPRPIEAPRIFAAQLRLGSGAGLNRPAKCRLLPLLCCSHPALVWLPLLSGTRLLPLSLFCARPAALPEDPSARCFAPSSRLSSRPPLFLVFRLVHSQLKPNQTTTKQQKNKLSNNTTNSNTQRRST